MKTLQLLIIFIFLFTFKISYSQAPFTTLSKQPTYIKKDKKKYVDYDIVEKIKSKQNNTSLVDFLKDEKVIPTKEKEDVDFFKNNSLSLIILNTGDNRMSINSQVIFYKINILTPTEDKTSNFKYNIPLMLISKLSSSYDSINASSSIDVLDYEAAPVTLRIMPSFKLSKNDKYNEKILFGFYTDARGININNPSTNNNSLEIIGSGGVGFTFQGDGEAGFYDENGEYESGKWLFSLMLQGAVGNKEVIQSLFNTEKDFVTSFQTYFSFKITENSKFNLKAGYQHFFQESISGNKNNFSIAIGM
jgi:hypothetical protein